MLAENKGRKTSDAQGPVVVILLGPPGCGKGTQSRELSRTIGLAHVSTGELLRRAAREGSALGRMVHSKMTAGELVPDNLVCQLVIARTTQPDCKRGVVLDGFPRTVDQANFLCPLLPPRQTIALNMQMSQPVLLQRIMGRLICPACGEIYNAHSRPPCRIGICDHDSAPLERRTDDTETVVRKRLVDYERQIRPLAEPFRKMNILQDIDADLQPSALSTQLCDLVQTAMGFSGNKFTISSPAEERATKRRRQ